MQELVLSLKTSLYKTRLVERCPAHPTISSSSPQAAAPRTYPKAQLREPGDSGEFSGEGDASCW
jgi:hypothetical protein